MMTEGRGAAERAHGCIHRGNLLSLHQFVVTEGADASSILFVTTHFNDNDR